MAMFMSPASTPTDNDTCSTVKCISEACTLLILAIFVILVVLWLLVSKYSNAGQYYKSRDNYSSQNHDTDTDISAKTKILAEVELKLFEFKQKQELIAEIRELKHQVSYLTAEKELDEQKIKELEADELLLTIKMEETESRYEKQITALNKELFLQDKKIHWFEERLKLTLRKLQDANKGLEKSGENLNETCSILEQTRGKLHQTRKALELTKVKYDETKMHLLKQQEITNTLRSELAQCEHKVMTKETEKMLLESALQNVVLEYEGKLKQTLNYHDATMREKRKEKRILFDQVADSEAQMKDLQTKVTGCRNALNLVIKEKKEMISEHKTLFEKFEVSFKELDKCTEKLKIS